MKNLAILGSTGSIGRSALAVVDAHPGRLRVVGLAAGDNAELLAEQVGRYSPEIVAMASDEAVGRLRASAREATRPVTAAGPEALVAVATHPSVTAEMEREYQEILRELRRESPRGGRAIGFDTPQDVR